MLYELVNMSDRYTFKADTLDTAAVVTILLGNGQYSAKPLDDETAQGVPFFMFGGGEEWFNKECGHTIEETVKQFVTGRRGPELVAALRSVLIGDRAEYEETVVLISEDKRVAWTKARHNRLCSSINDIGKRALQLADRLEKGSAAPAPDPTPAQVFVG